MARFEAALQDFISFHPTAGASPDALYELGLMYALGRDVKTNLVEAHKWLNVAAIRGNLAARRMRAEIAEEMSKIDLIKAQRLAREWLTKH